MNGAMSARCDDLVCLQTLSTQRKCAAPFPVFLFHLVCSVRVLHHISSHPIPPCQELTYDYNYKLGSVHDKEGNVRRLECHCLTAECKGWVM